MLTQVIPLIQTMLPLFNYFSVFYGFVALISCIIVIRSFINV